MIDNNRRSNEHLPYKVKRVSLTFQFASQTQNGLDIVVWCHVCWKDGSHGQNHFYYHTGLRGKATKHTQVDFVHFGVTSKSLFETKRKKCRELRVPISLSWWKKMFSYLSRASSNALLSMRMLLIGFGSSICPLSWWEISSRSPLSTSSILADWVWSLALNCSRLSYVLAFCSLRKEWRMELHHSN